MQNQIKSNLTWWRGLGLSTLAALSLLIALPAKSAYSVKQTQEKIPKLPDFVQSSLDFRALRNGDWLVLDKKSLRLLKANGTERAAYKVRAKHFDIRESVDQSLVVLIDSDTQHAVPIRVQDGKLSLAMELPAPSGALEFSNSCICS